MMSLINKIVTDILRELEDSIESLYLGGTRAIGAEKPGSDYDFFAIVNEKYDFDKEEDINDRLSNKYDKKIRLRGLCLNEMNGGKQRGTITRYIPVPIMLKSFNKWVHLAGKEYSLNDFETEPATVKEEIEFYINKLKDLRKAAERGELAMPFGDYVKCALRLIGAEGQSRGQAFRLDFEKIVKDASPKAKELANICLEQRKTGKIDKEEFFRKLDDYLKSFE